MLSLTAPPLPCHGTSRGGSNVLTPHLGLINVIGMIGKEGVWWARKGFIVAVTKVGDT